MKLSNSIVRKGLVRAFLLCAVLLFAGGTGATAAGPFLEPDVEVLHTFTGENIGDTFGWVAADLGDLNGDGVKELLIPAILNGENGPAAGKVYIYSGRDQTLLRAHLGNPGETYGYSASNAEDVNADGVSDYIIGGPGGGATPGRVAVHSGADGSILLEWTDSSDLAFGASVTGAGDVNGDGHADLFIGAPQASFSFPQAGRVFLYSGMDGSLLWTRDGRSGGSLLGSGLGQVGLLDGDGAPELVAAAPGAGRQSGGEAYVLSGVDGRTRFTLRPAPPNRARQFGTFFASGAGDVNADGIPDIFIGDYADGFKGPGSGRAYIFSGADGSRLRAFNGENGEGFGPGRGVGDVNGDGYGDLYIGAYTNSEVAPNAGKAYLYSGKDGALLRTMTGTAPSEYLGVDALAVGDVNGDGKTDFLLTGVNFDGTGLDHTYLIAGN